MERGTGDVKNERQQQVVAKRACNGRNDEVDVVVVYPRCLALSKSGWRRRRLPSLSELTGGGFIMYAHLVRDSQSDRSKRLGSGSDGQQAKN